MEPHQEGLYFSAKNRLAKEVESRWGDKIRENGLKASYHCPMTQLAITLLWISEVPS